MPLRIFVAENNEVIRSVICALLVAHPEWDVCGEAADGAHVIPMISELKPDIVLVGFDMPGKNGLELTRELLQRQSSCKVLILVTAESALQIRDIFDAGALGFVVRARATQELVLAVDALHQGRTFFTARFADSMLKERLDNQAGAGGMTDREREGIRQLVLELATSSSNQRPGAKPRHPSRRYAMAALLIAASAAGGWVTYRGAWRQVLPEIKELSVKAGINPPPPPPARRGNPDRKVWIDVHTAQYYCPGSSLYGHTRRGYLATQAEAQRDNFEPSGMKVCE